MLEEGALHDSNFSLLHLNTTNTRSLSKKATNVVDYISILNHDFDVIGFTETWFNNIEESNLIDLDNYDKLIVFVTIEQVVVRPSLLILNITLDQI